MAYERDRDGHTRGIGAIAASDHLPGARRRKALIARTTMQRDRALKGLTMGARGGLVGGRSALGVVSAVGKPWQSARAPIVGGGSMSPDGPGYQAPGVRPVSMPPYTPTSPLPPFTRPPSRFPDFVRGSGMMTAGGGGFVPGQVPGTPPQIDGGGGGTTDPTGTPNGTTAPDGGGGGVYTSGGTTGGGGGGGGGGGAGYTPPTHVPPTFDTTPVNIDDPISPSSSTIPWGWIAAGGIGLILLLRRGS